jgi:hypothetical protein
VETYKIYIFKVLKQEHLGIRISDKAMSTMNSIINDIFNKPNKAFPTTLCPQRDLVSISCPRSWEGSARHLSTYP